MGNILEFYDFILFAHMASVLGPKFFPNQDASVSHLITLGIFSLSFIARPVGAIVFGRISDIHGRGTAIMRSILLLTIPTLVIALLPTYETLGIVAPIILVIARLLQGVALGGEFNNAGLLIVESSKERPCLFSSMLGSSSQIGSLIALLCTIIVIQYSDIENLWRVPFLFGSVIGFCNYILRRKLVESKEYKEYVLDNKIKSTFHFMNINILKVFFVGGLTGILIYMPITFTNLYVTKHLGMSPSFGLYLTFISSVVYIIMMPIVGFFSDSIKISKLMRNAALLVVFMIIPVYYLLIEGYFVAFQIISTVLTAICNANIHVYMKELFPVGIRGRAISLGFSLGISIIGGTIHLAFMLISYTNNVYSPAIYVLLIALIAYIVLGINSKRMSL